METRQATTHSVNVKRNQNGNRGRADGTQRPFGGNIAHSTSADSIEMPAEIIGTPPLSGNPAPIGTSSPIITSGGSGFDPNEGNRRNDLQDMEGESDEAEEKFSVVNEALGSWGMDATPAVTSSPPETKPDTKEGSGMIGQTVPTTERCVTPMGLLSADSSSRPRTSPKRKLLYSPEGRKIATGWENAVKRHLGSMPEHTPFSRLPGRMPYGMLSLAEEEGLGAAGEGGDESPICRGEEEPVVPRWHQDIGEPSEPQRGDESKDPLCIASSGRDEPSGPSGVELTLAE